MESDNFIHGADLCHQNKNQEDLECLHVANRRFREGLSLDAQAKCRQEFFLIKMGANQAVNETEQQQQVQCI